MTLGSVTGQSVDNSASKAGFTINATVAIKGAFVCRGTSVLLGAAAFATVRNMAATDVLNVTVTSSAASANQRFISRRVLAPVESLWPLPPPSESSARARSQNTKPRSRMRTIPSFAASDLLTLTLTLYGPGGTVINSRAAQNALNANNVTIDANGLVTWLSQPADNVIQGNVPVGHVERHYALFQWTTDSSAGNYLVQIDVQQMLKVT